MACGNARREAYTAGGEATLLSLEILNVDVFVLIIVGAAPEAPLQARRNGSSGVRERPHSHGMACRGTWEARHCPRMMAGTWTTGRGGCCNPSPAYVSDQVHQTSYPYEEAFKQDTGAPHGQNHWKETLEETMSSMNTSTKRQWIAAQAREYPERVLTTLHRFIDFT